MTWRATDPEIGLQPISETSTVKNHSLGKIIRGTSPTYGDGEFIYLKGVGSTVVGSLVMYDPYLGTTVLNTTTGGIGPVAVAMSANVLANYGWYQIAGTAAVLAPNAMTAGANVYALAATAASVDDAQVNGEQVLNAVVTASTGTPSTGLGLITINRPFMQGQTV